MLELIQEFTGKNFENISFEQAKFFAKELGLENNFQNIGEIITEVFEEKCESKLIQPTFVLNYPWESSPLTGSSPDSRVKLKKVSEYKNNLSPKTEYAQRFELYIGGYEVANGFTEQNDPRRQREAFLDQARKKQDGDEEAHPLDEDFIKALEYAMPPAGGVGIGIDRLVMLLTNSLSIREVILFPTMRVNN